MLDFTDIICIGLLIAAVLVGRMMWFQSMKPFRGMADILKRLEK